MLADCLFSQPFWGLFQFQNSCLDNSNPNSAIRSTVNQFETPVSFDIFTRRFSFSFISVASLSMKFLHFSSILSFFISVLSLSRLTSIMFRVSFE